MEKIDYINLVNLPLIDIFRLVDELRRETKREDIDLCSIVNAKSGTCSENCKFCAQSSHHSTSVLKYPILSANEIVEEANKAVSIGARRFGIVTSGNSLTSDEIEIICDAILKIKSIADIDICASLGALPYTDFVLLKKSGLKRYHHNIETSPRFYAQMVTTHDFSERILTIKNAKKAGLEVCSGGIIGLGETWEDRIDMAILLSEMHVNAVPINILVPIAGTPLQYAESLSVKDILKTIAIFKLILKTKVIKIAAGREKYFDSEYVKLSYDTEINEICKYFNIKDPGTLIYLAGASGMMIGGYLTIRGREVKDDYKLLDEVFELWGKEK
ncbi:MAG: biotin synthase BioB [Candidatus Omnitrophica bacterium]|nr:biotin synthase BioB [Candidatus Omnitrophota bacterium]